MRGIAMTGDGPNPSGLCQCGCGLSTPLARQSRAERGWISGKPIRYMPGHSVRGRKLRVGDDYVVDANGCWVWQHAKTSNGYGRVRHAGTDVMAHRLYYEKARGPIPAGLDLDHLCRNRACVNPAHLEPVTRAVNAQRGARARLTEQDVGAIRASTDSYSSLALRFGVSKGAIQAIKQRSTWRDVA